MVSRARGNCKKHEVFRTLGPKGSGTRLTSSPLSLVQSKLLTQMLISSCKNHGLAQMPKHHKTHAKKHERDWHRTPPVFWALVTKKHSPPPVWLAGWVAGGLVGWLVGWLAGWSVGWLAGGLAGWLVGGLAGWLAGWLANKLGYRFRYMYP